MHRFFGTSDLRRTHRPHEKEALQSLDDILSNSDVAETVLNTLKLIFNIAAIGLHVFNDIFHLKAIELALNSVERLIDSLDFTKSHNAGLNC